MIVHVPKQRRSVLVVPYPLVYMAQMFTNQNELERAVEILAVLQKHPLRFEQTDQVAQTLRNDLEVKVEPERFAAAWEHGQSLDLETIVAELLAEYAS